MARTTTPYIANVFSQGYDDTLLYKGDKEISKAVAKVISMGRKFERELHLVAMSCLYHAEQHGDFTKCSKLVNGLRNGRSIQNGSARVRSLITWFEDFAPMSYKDGTGGALGQFKKATGDNVPKYDLAKAAINPFWDWTEEAEPVDITLADVYQMVMSVAKRVEGLPKAKREGASNQITSDAEATKKVLALATSLKEAVEEFKPEDENDDDNEE